MDFYIGDLHLGYEKMLAARPYSTVKEMNDEIIYIINNTVKSDQTLWIDGDVSCYDYDPTEDLQKMKCKKILVAGNHDKHWVKYRHFRNCFEKIYPGPALYNDGDIKLCISHYPMAEWDGYYKGRYLFYSHIHNSTTGAAAIMSLYENAANVGIDVVKRPRTAEELISYRKKVYNPEASVEEILKKLRCGAYFEDGTNSLNEKKDTGGVCDETIIR